LKKSKVRVKVWFRQTPEYVGTGLILRLVVCDKPTDYRPVPFCAVRLAFTGN